MLNPSSARERSGPVAITPGVGRWDRVSADGCAQLLAAARVDAANRVRIPQPLVAEAFALDLVGALGPDGSFLEADHTLAHYRPRSYPTLLDRRSRGAGAAAGGLALGPRAADRVDAVLAGHAVPPPLPEAASAELREIVALAEARAGL